MALSAEQFVALMAAHQREVYRYILVMMPSAADADDVYQETALALFADRARFEPGTNFAAWATSVARHRILAARKKLGRDRHVFSADLIDAIAQQRAELSDELAERRGALEHCLRRLSDAQRDLIDSRYGGDETIQQVADRTGRPVKTLYKTLERVRGALLRCIEQRLEGGAA